MIKHIKPIIEHSLAQWDFIGSEYKYNIYEDKECLQVVITIKIGFPFEILQSLCKSVPEFMNARTWIEKHCLIIKIYNND
jgi:hypothetical protein